MLLNITDHIKSLDRSLFILLNNDWTNPVLDAILPWLRNSSLWMPLYLFLLFFVTLNFGIKSGWWIIFFIATVALTDMTGTYVFKHNIQRLRPCNDPDMFMYVRLVVQHCSGGYSFTSNHAANHFGMATFFYITFRHIIGKWATAGFVWAGLIAYAQVYVGVHYPMDVMAGALLGLLVGNVTGRLFNRKFSLSAIS